jgi:hypothetical protein
MRKVLAGMLALALCACGGGGDARGGEAGGARATDSAASVAPVAAAQASDTCTAPPPAYAADLLSGPWSALVARLAADGITFPEGGGNDAEMQMRLCPDCAPVSVRVRSSHLTPCLGAEHLTGEPRIVGMFTLQAGFPAQHGWEALSSGDSVFVFANAADAPAVLVHNSAGTARSGPDGAMQFVMCSDGHTSNRPQVRVRAVSQGTEAEADKGKGKGPDDDVSCPNLPCKSGCCLWCCCGGPLCKRD